MPNENSHTDDILETLADMNEAIGNRFDKIDRNIMETRSDADSQFSEIRNQLDRIEHSILEEHARRIEVLERKVGISS